MNLYILVAITWAAVGASIWYSAPWWAIALAVIVATGATGVLVLFSLLARM